METKAIGLYLHIPFCVRKCNYCDFCSESAETEKIERYAECLINEIESYQSEKKILIDSIFIGGGTPSILSPRSFEKIVSVIRKTFEITSDAEFTLEANPGTVSLEKISVFKSCGVNRISLGLQSIHENELKILGRIHTYDEFLEAYDMVKKHLTDNINIDLMYGIPEQSISSFKKTLQTVIALSPAHISCYGLIVEEGTAFFRKRNSLNFPSEDEECDMYDMAHAMLSAKGYEHYEISNYALYGKRCRHNLKYWRDEEYIGLGLSAHSYYLGKRYSATEKIDEYFDDFGTKYRKEERETIGKDPFEYAMLALRLSDGFSLSEYKKLFNMDFTEGKNELLKIYSEKGLIKIENNRIYLTHKGFYVSNSIMAELLDFSS